MNLSVGIVGLPNIGKSSLFNILTKLQALAANYPFATIEPNVGIVPVYDERLKVLADLSKSQEIKPAYIQFIDIAGLVKGASQGLGLGNQFLGHIKQADAILHLVRLFDNTDIIHVEGDVNPKRDIEIINTELILKDLETLNKRIIEVKAKAKSGVDDKTKKYLDLLISLKDFLDQNNLANKYNFSSDEDKKLLSDLNLITLKPIIYVANVDDNHMKLSEKDLKNRLGLSEDEIVTSINIKLESEILSLKEQEQLEYRELLGINLSGIEKITQLGYKILNLITFFTTGEKETKAWTIYNGTKAPQAAGVIHTDFEKNFISLEVVNYNDFIKFKSWNNAKENGAIRLEGKNYIVQDGDIVIVKHSA